MAVRPAYFGRMDEVEEIERSIRPGNIYEVYTNGWKDKRKTLIPSVYGADLLEIVEQSMERNPESKDLEVGILDITDSPLKGFPPIKANGALAHP